MHAIATLMTALALSPPGVHPAVVGGSGASSPMAFPCAPVPRASRPAAARTPGPEYYAIELFTTKNLPGTGYAIGTADVAVSATSPFAVALASDGSYRYDVSVALERMRTPRDGVLVAWVATKELDGVVRLGTLDAEFTARGSVGWNQFIVIVTLEPSDDSAATRWTGPVAFRGMSRSGMMHTMVGHGAFQEENCAAYGYGN